MTSIDDFTIHCVEMTIKELIMNNEDYQRNIDSIRAVECDLPISMARRSVEP